MQDPLTSYLTANRRQLLLAAGALIVAIAVLDWLTKPYLSLGFLYLFAIMMVAGVLRRWQTVAVALVCAVLQEAFSNLPEHEAVARLILSSTGFVGTGLLFGEVVRNRRTILKHVAELEDQMRLRRDAEDQLRVLVESSPAAIVVIDSGGTILHANEAAQQLFAPGARALVGQSIRGYLPSLQAAVQTHPSQVFRTVMQCRGQRDNRETFLAGVWFSTYTTISGPRLAAVVVDLSEDLQSRDELSLDHLLKHARVVMSAITHEIRNLSSAARMVHTNLSRVKELEANEDFRALNTLIQGLENVSALELQSSAAQNAGGVELTPVLDEVRVLIDTAYRDSGIEVEWAIPERLRLVRADRYGLVQVFLNLAKNSQRAMQSAATKQLTVQAFQEPHRVVIRFQDTGPGIATPENLFRPFQRDAEFTGLGLFVSRAVMRSFGGDLVYEPRPRGCCFAVMLPVFAPVEMTVNA